MTIGFISQGYLDIQWQLGFGINDKVDFIAKEEIVLALGSPLGIGVRVASGTITFPLTLAGLLTELIRISPEVSGIYSGIAAQYYL